MSQKMNDVIQGNMSESQLFDMLHKLLNDCRCCNVSYRQCRQKAPCYPCEVAFWIGKLKKHFGMV